MNLLIKQARILTLRGSPSPRRKAQLGELGVIPQGDILIQDGRITAVGGQLKPGADTKVIDVAGRVVMPGFVDCHTHACWAGERLGEWEQKLRGVPYLEILRAGGGIHASVRSLRAASESQLAASLRARLDLFLRAGTTTVEVKSGYGLDVTNELKMLRAIRQAAGTWSGTVQATALLGHAMEGEAESFVNRTVTETLPAVAREFPGIAVDAYCEQGAWSVADCRRLFAQARDGHPLRAHADQFNSLGLVEEMIRLGARSVDHLEASSEETLRHLADSQTVGVLLPATGFHTDQRYARARYLVDQGGAVALATNCNPGTSPTHSMPLAIALAVRCCGLTPAEAITAATVNAAAVLGLPDRGRIEPGVRADLIVLRHTDERALAFELGDNPVAAILSQGVPVGPMPALFG